MSYDHEPYFNPLASAILAAPRHRRFSAGEKQRQVRRAQNLRKDFAVREDHFEHQVESAEELHAVDDGNPDQSNPPRERGVSRTSNPERRPAADRREGLNPLGVTAPDRPLFRMSASLFEKPDVLGRSSGPCARGRLCGEILSRLDLGPHTPPTADPAWRGAKGERY